MRYLTVDLFEDFQCIAGACPNSCCIGWKIPVEKNIFKEMQRHEEELGISAAGWLKKEDGEYYSVILDGQRCPMLTRENLCQVVLRLGPEYLSRTCSVFPRSFNQYGGVVERYLSASCPEVISMLMDKDFIEFSVSEDLEPEPEYAHMQLYQFESAVRAGLVSILQEFPQIALNARLFASFMILQKAVGMYQEHRLDIPAIQLEIAACLDERNLYALEEKLNGSVDENARFRLLSQLPALVNEFAPTGRFEGQVQRAVRYFAEVDHAQYLSDVEAFKKSCCLPYHAFYSNYWVYRIFADTLSIPDYEKSKEKMIYIGMEFAIFQSIALAGFAEHGRLDRTEYLSIISSLSRTTENYAYFRHLLAARIRDNHLVSAAGLLLLIVT